MSMRRVAPDDLRRGVRAIFARAGSEEAEARAVGDHLVEANLVGHDSHGVIRVAKYMDWLKQGQVVVNRHVKVLRDDGVLLMLDGQFGYGQAIGLEAMRLGVAKAKKHGVAVMALRDTGHLGRIGAWAEMAAGAGLVALHFVNSSGFGMLVAPHGGSDRRLSANPIAAGVPSPDGAPMILDMSTCIIAEGKIQVARNKKEKLPEGAVLNGKGRPTRDPEEFYAPPPGAILPIAGHKGSGLSLICEVLAGALTGGGSTHPDNPTAKRMVNNMLTILIDADNVAGHAAFAADVSRLRDWVKASPPITPGGEVLLPGEIERRTRADREKNGIPLDDATRAQIAKAAADVGLPAGEIEKAIG
ncbi:MAG: malate/lactate/ureidoglycolate dehydrogenase [Alphaproteobacteria bacterium]|nr:malate/lactate/ureidoglycolate dehydrogenase [Alphaproteobacteria bacterium]